ncbi:MAG: hypothetical protein WDM81_08845 [Rhizomicrobium sp.]
MGTIPKKVQPLIDGAFPQNVCLIARCSTPASPRSRRAAARKVYDDDHVSLWERGRGTTTALLSDGTKVTVFYFNLGARDVLPIGGIVRLYGTATVHKSGPVYEKVWERLIAPEKDWDKEKKGWAVLIKVDRAEDLLGQPIKVD